MSKTTITITHGFRGLLRPSKEQEELIIKTFGCCRKLWNVRLEAFNNKELPKTLPQYKILFPYMKEVDSLALCGVERNQTAAFKNHKRDPERFNYPKFKSKYSSRQSYTTCNQKGSVRFEDLRHLKLPKLGVVRCKMFGKLPGRYKITFATISRECDGKYYISLTITYEKEIELRPLEVAKAIGLDYSLPNFYVNSDGETPNYPHYFYQYEQLLAEEQRKLSRMQKGSHNHQKQKLRIAKLHRRITNLRREFCHQLSHKLAIQYDIICVEDMDLSKQAEHKNWGKKTTDNGFGMFRNFLQYKLEEQGKKFIKINKWTPSSKTCHECGAVNSNLQLGELEWTCPSCGAHINRDHNAALNILSAGLATL